MRMVKSVFLDSYIGEFLMHCPPPLYESLVTSIRGIDFKTDAEYIVDFILKYAE